MPSQQPIVYIITKLELGGAQKICLSLFHELIKKGHPTFLITGNEGVLVDEVKDLPNVFLLNCLRREISVRNLWYEIKTFFSLVHILRKLKKKHPNIIVHTHSSKAGVMGRLAAVVAGIKSRVHTVHGFAFHPHQRLILWLIAFLCEWVCALWTTRFVCVSSADVKTGIRFLPGFSNKHALIRAAVETDYFFIPAQQASSFPASGKPFVFGTISCLKPQKNIFDMLRAFECVHEQNSQTRLEIIGDGVLRQAVKKWVAEHNLEHAIIMHGWQHDVRPFLQQWHCFALSSLWEGLPCVLVEARLSKLPVICYDAGGIRDIIHHGVNGFIYPCGEWIQLAKGMLSLCNDELLFMTIRHYPDNFGEFDMKAMVEKHSHLYSTLKRI